MYISRLYLEKYMDLFLSEILVWKILSCLYKYSEVLILRVNFKLDIKKISFSCLIQLHAFQRSYKLISWLPHSEILLWTVCNFR